MLIRASIALAVVTLAVGYRATAAEFIPLGTLYPNHEASFAQDVSADGRVVVGGSRVSLSKDGAEAFLWTAESGMIGLGELPGGNSSGASSVSGDGAVVGGGSESSKSGPSHNEPIRWTEATGLEGLGGFPGGLARGVINGVSFDGSVMVGSGANANEGNEPVRWTQATGVQRLGESISGQARGISADAQIVTGWADHGGHSEAFRWTQAGGYQFLGMIPGSSANGSSLGLGVSADGLTIVGASTNAAGISEAFRWTSSQGMIPLGWLGQGSQALDTSADGSVVVGSIFMRGSEDMRAFVWSQPLGMLLLDDWLRSYQGLDKELAGWQLFEAMGVSANGETIVGYGKNPAGNLEGFVVTVPEPSTGCLMLLAACPLALYLRRRA
jgi:probable HAF family extracellular repeat protein